MINSLLLGQINQGTIMDTKTWYDSHMLAIITFSDNFLFLAPKQSIILFSHRVLVAMSLKKIIEQQSVHVL